MRCPEHDLKLSPPDWQGIEWCRACHPTRWSRLVGRFLFFAVRFAHARRMW